MSMWQIAQKVINACSNVCDNQPRDILLVIYRTLVEHHFQYCNVVWGHLTDGLSHQTPNITKQSSAHNYQEPL